MTYDRKIYKEAEYFLKNIKQSEVYYFPEKVNKEQNKAIQMLITYNVLCKKGNLLQKGPAFQDVQHAGLKNYIRGFDAEYTPSFFEVLWNLLTKNPLLLAIIIVLLSAWLTMQFME